MLTIEKLSALAAKPAAKAEAAMGVPRLPSPPALRDVTVTVPLPSPELLERQSEPDCEIPPSDRLLGPIPEMTRLIYERQCYKNAEAVVRSKLQLLQDTIASTIKGLNDAPRPAAATPPPPPRSKSPPPPPEMVWARIDGRRGPEVAQQTEVDFATCKELAGALAAQLQQRDTFNLNLRACMRQHGYKAPAQ